MHVHRKLLVAFCICYFSTVGSVFSDIPDPNTYYRLSTEFRGSGMSLDVFNGGPKNNFVHLVPSQNFTGQLWQFVSNRDGTFKLKTQFNGLGKCLDVVNGGENDNEPHFTECGEFSGQSWIVVPEGPWVMLKTKFRGDGMCLDIFNGGSKNDQPYLKPYTRFAGGSVQRLAAVVSVQRIGPSVLELERRAKRSASSRTCRKRLFPVLARLVCRSRRRCFAVNSNNDRLLLADCVAKVFLHR
jgi:hypothetical protein